ncbi:unnamed protein product [Anisakis simplex]|uniref:IRS-type PTB domain-containing protein n=1 Tax=Anisakis simplex TaxID=6269 RepID=A0A3P6S5G7_ANISI|nr:unnamed protein product [Anisakis simplex]
MKECISVMLPDETFFLKPLSDADDLEDWFSQLIDKTRQARATRLGRPVFREEYFEIAWDVEMVKLPKLRKKSKGVDNMEDVVSKYSEQLLGKRRMCMYPHSVIIARRGLTASANGFPPLHPDEFMEFPMNAVSNFGKQEKYFFLRVGRFAPTGAGELWLCTESGDCAASIYEKVSKICERESEKRRSQGGRLPSHTSSRRSGLHRDRAHTQSHRPQTDTSALSSAFDNSRKTSAVSISSMFPTSSPPATNLSARSSSFCIAGHASATRGATPNVARQPIKEESAKTSPSELPKLPASDGSGVVKFVANRNNSDELFGDDPDESSGGTIMYIGDQDAAGRCGDETPKCQFKSLS